MKDIKKRTTRGRPKKDDFKETETFYKVDILFERNQALVEKKKKEAGMFVLIRNKTDEEKLSDLEVLKEYKQQHSVESTLRILKDPYYVDEIFLKSQNVLRHSDM